MPNHYLTAMVKQSLQIKTKGNIMSYEIIHELLEKLSCAFVLADPEEDPQSLSCLLPILKQTHTRCMEQSLTGNAKKILKARTLINDILQNSPLDITEKMGALSALISELSHSMENLNEPDKITELAEKPTEDRSDLNYFLILEEKLQKLTTLIGLFCAEEIPDLGAMLNNLDELIEASKEITPSTFYEIAMACKGYVDHMTLENICNTTPIEEGAILLKSILNHLERNEPFAFDYSDVLELLNYNFIEEQKTNEEQKTEEDLSNQEPENLSDDDMEIMIDFVSEAEENLDTIEVNLMNLEQDPSNRDIINDIFRPFHTIKGVSGFLAMTKINKLAHATENLLDGARSGEFLINNLATNVILESLDTLKKLIARVKTGVQNRVKQQDDDIDIEDLRYKLSHLQISLSKGEKEPLGEILVRKGVVDTKSLQQSLKIQQGKPHKKIGEILVQENKATHDEVDAALRDQNCSTKKMDTQVKVSTQKLDDLVDYAGELVIAQSMLRQKTAHDFALSQSVAHLGQIVTNMQTIAMSMRMIPIKATFMKMIRLVRDLAQKSGKEVALSMKGEETEIDRNVVDALYEPMVHMIRNSVDHGIESEKERVEKGKDPTGNIILRAYHKGGHIIIEIEDDGKGLDRERILEKAKSSGLISHNAKLSDTQIYDLILQPGFSTAQEITDLSGRGVGMDVVKSGIEKFRGQLNIKSSKGRGTKFTISFPLTLAIIDGMLVRVDGERYVIPTISIQKAFRPARKEYFTVEGKGEMVMDRGNLIPLIRLNEIYNTGSHKKPVWEGLVVVTESKDEKRALLIDELLGKDEYVIKSLGASFKGVKGISGGAILADGRVGLILDIDGIFSIV